MKRFPKHNSFHPYLALFGLSMFPIFAGCNSLINNGDAVSANKNEVVYGQDNRQDVYAYPEVKWRNFAVESNVVLMYKTDVDPSNPQNIKLNGPTLKEAQELCPGERFANQPAIAYCSGTLIDDDKILTAGHCVITEYSCKQTYIVFRYMMESENKLATVTADDLFSCKKILAHKISRSVDYSVVQLDRPATPRFVPATVNKIKQPMMQGSGVVAIGSGTGLPMKIIDNGIVMDPHADTLDAFVTNTDTFAGNSGSGVFDLNGKLVGILIGGEDDYVFDDDNNCYHVNTCEEKGCESEKIDYGSGKTKTYEGEKTTYVFNAIQDLCIATPSSHLCGN